jgi:hypothetical protein
MWHDMRTEEPEHGIKCLCVVEQEGFGQDLFTLWYDQLRKIWYLQDIIYSDTVRLGDVTTKSGCALADKFNRVRVVKWTYAWELL